MNRRIWTAILAGTLAFAALATVGIGAYRAGRDSEVTTRVVTEGEAGETEVVRVIGDHGPRGPGFLLPLLVIVLLAVLASRLWGGWGRPPGFRGGPGYDRLEEWHRRAHEAEGSPPPAASGET